MTPDEMETYYFPKKADLAALWFIFDVREAESNEDDGRWDKYNNIKLLWLT